MYGGSQIFLVKLVSPHMMYCVSTPKQPVSKRLVTKFKKPNLASFKTAKIHNAYVSKCVKKPSFFVSRLVLNIRTKKYYRLIAEQFCKATAAPNNPVDLESQNLSLLTLLIFLIEGLLNKLCIS
jgi:hypothetical protein